MKFKEWLHKIEEAQKNNQGQSSNSPYMSYASTASRFGSAVTQLPVPGSLDDIDNALYAGLAGGVGAGIHKGLMKMGHNIGQVQRIEPYPKDQKPDIKHGTLPLQIPVIGGEAKLSQNFTYGKAGIKSLRNVLGDRSYEDSRIRRIGDPDLSDIAPPQKFELYNDSEQEKEGIRSYQTATEFTKALIHVMIRDMIEHNEQEKNVLDADTIEFESSQINKYENISGLSCVFSVKPKQIIQKNREEQQ
jgi:hypothetical protein